MKIVALFLALSLASPLASCAGVNVSGTKSLADAEKTLTIANYAYQGIGETLKTAANTNILRGANAATVKVYYDKAGDALLAAKKAVEAANAQSILDQVSLAQDAIAQADAIIHPKK